MLQILGPTPKFSVGAKSVPEITLKTHPDVEEIQLEFPLALEIALKVAPKGRTFRIKVSGPDSGRRPDVDLGSQEVSGLTVSHAKVSLSGSGLWLPGMPEREPFSFLECSAASAIVEGREIQEIRISQNSWLELRHASTDRLVVTRGTCLTARCDDEVRALSFVGPSGNEQLDLDLVNTSRLAVPVLQGARVRLSSDTRLEVTEDASDVRLVGPGTLIINNRSRSITFEDPPACFELAEHAQAQDVQGNVVLKQATRAHLSSPKSRPGGEDVQHFTITDLDDDGVQGSSLLDVCLPPSLKGRQMISILNEHASTVVPLVHRGLPGNRWSDLRRLRAFNPVTTDHHIEADYARALADLAANKGAPGSVRTKLAWCSYRMRALTASGLVERVMLALYRLLGYGERAVPTFGTYIVLALVAAMFSLSDRGVDLSPEGAGRLGTAWVDWLLTPLHLFRLAEVPLGDGLWSTLGRVAVTIPFATGVIALRNYVKDSHRERT